MNEEEHTTPPAKRDPGSYRDPAGFVFRRDGVLYRQVQASFAEDWDAFMASGLYERLAAGGASSVTKTWTLALAA